MLLIVPARLEDARVLFEWRNDPLTRAMSRSPEMVTWEEHVTWLNKRLKSPAPHVFIATAESFPIRDFTISPEINGVAVVPRQGPPVGVFHVNDDRISCTVAPEYRGQGVGAAMYRAAVHLFGPLRAEIYQRNVASIKVAERAGLRVHIIPDEADRS